VARLIRVVRVNRACGWSLEGGSGRGRLTGEGRVCVVIRLRRAKKKDRQSWRPGLGEIEHVISGWISW